MEEDLIVERRCLRILEAGSSSHWAASFGCNRLVVTECRPRGPQEVWVWVLATLQEAMCGALDKLAPVNVHQNEIIVKYLFKKACACMISEDGEWYPHKNVCLQKVSHIFG